MDPLTALGYDAQYAAAAALLLQPGQVVARVIAVDRESYMVGGERGDLRAEVAGRLRFTADTALDLPGVGDWVTATCSSTGDLAVIHAVLPRRTLLQRKTAGRVVDCQLLAANLDIAFIIQDCEVDFNVARLERYLVAVADGGITPQLILSKTDLVSAAAAAQREDEIRRAGITAPVLRLSNATGDGLDALRALLPPGRTCCLLGSSGVGKTTLLNRLTGEDLPTRAVSGTGEGVHTTTRRQLLQLAGGALLIDTPGMREFGLVGAGDGLAAAFADIATLAAGCRFADCTHRHEPGCAVRAAVADGTLSDERLQRYRKLCRESEFHELSYAQRRQKDRAFGRMVKTVLKQQRDT